VHVQTVNDLLTPDQLAAQAEDDFRWLLDDERGQRIARTLLCWTGVEEAGPVAGVEAMAFAAGSRAVGVMLKKALRQHHPEGWVHMEAELAKETALHARRAVAADTKANASGVKL
jgi:hypothetical protein